MVSVGGVTRPRSGRGMVTAELAVAILAALSLFLVLCWGILLVVQQLRIVDTAAAVARQEARGDRDAAAVVRAQAPGGASVEVRRRAGQVVVRVELTVQPLRGGRLAVPLAAEASVVEEPGGAGR
ncbi:hypothetical protein GCM10009616_00400 [Microlunatus lacustris]